MKKFTTLFGALCLSGAMFLGQAQDVFIAGPFNSFNPDGNSQWKLTQGDEDDGEENLYTGYFEIEAGEFDIYFIQGENILIPATESNVDIVFNDGTFTGNFMSGQEASWVNESWTGGELAVLLNFDGNEVTFQADTEVPEVWYIRGPFNNFEPDDNALYALFPDSSTEANGVYTGTFNIPAGQFSINLLDPNGTVYIPSNLDTVEIEFTDDIYEGYADYAWDEIEATYTWTYPSWEGGTIVVTIDSNEGTLTIINDPSAGPIEPAPISGDIFISGLFNGYNPDGASEWQLFPGDEEDGEANLYTGYFEIPEGQFSFNFLWGDNQLVPLTEEDFEVTFVDNSFSGGMIVGKNAYWTYEDWTGGELAVQLNMDDNTLVFTITPAVADVWYISGEFNGFEPAGEEEWALNPVEDENGVYSGTFEIAAGEFSFNLLDPNGTVYIPSDLDTVEIEFTDDIYEGYADYAWDEIEATYTWTYPSWEGGTIQVTIDANTGELTIVNVADTDAIKTISTQDGKVVIYNLQGVKMDKNNLTPGLYIINGKKTLVK